jgi:hypothetical protein
MTKEQVLANKLKLAVEKLGWTFAQQFAITLLAFMGASSAAHQPWLAALDASLFAAATSVITSALTALAKIHLTGLADVALRGVLTFGQSFVGTLVAGQFHSVLHADWKAALVVAVPVTLTAVIKGIAALGLPQTISASTVPLKLAA